MLNNTAWIKFKNADDPQILMITDNQSNTFLTVEQTLDVNFDHTRRSEFGDRCRSETSRSVYPLPNQNTNKLKSFELFVNCVFLETSFCPNPLTTDVLLAILPIHIVLLKISMKFLTKVLPYYDHLRKRRHLTSSNFNLEWTKSEFSKNRNKFESLCSNFEQTAVSIKRASDISPFHLVFRGPLGLLMFPSCSARSNRSKDLAGTEIAKRS